MAWSPGPIVTRRRLGGELKRLRDASGLKLEQVAKQLECSTSKISRLENGKGIPRARDVRDLLDAYGVTDPEIRSRLDEWARTGQSRMWWQDYADVLPLGLDTYVEYEWDAARICAYESHLVHGLLQTPDYAAAILRTWHADRPQRELDRMVEVRLRRQEALAADHGLSFRCVLDESTLYRVVGSPAVQRGQLQHLLHLAAEEHVDLRVLPFSAGLVATNLSPFAVLEFSAGLESGLVHVESPDGTSFFADATKLREYEKRMGDIVGASLSETESVPLIQHAIDLIRS